MSADSSSKGAVTSGKKIRKEEALAYHSMGRPGKIEVIPTKPCATARDLSLAYSPGVAEPCLEIEKDPDLSYAYTARGNLVAVISNGTAVLGLGDIGALAGKPVMEGKGVLFKKFADIDVFDIEVEAKDIEKFCTVVKALEPTFGGINLEDIKAPECFVIEERLKREMNIPVFHDDQHGTAIISGAALLNAAELAGKQLDKLKVVVSGAGASAIACTKFYLKLGVKKENVILVDTKGVVFKGRTEGMNEYKAEFIADTKARTLEDALVGADVFLGCSAKGLMTQDMVRSMATDPIVFALANPDPEISYPDAKAARADVIMATGRSDYPNQVNNVLGLPLHLPRRARRPRQGHHRGDEDGGGPGAGPAGQGGRARVGVARLRRRALQLRPRLHHPQAARPARAALGGPRRGRGGHRERRGPHPARPLRLPREAEEAAEPGARRDEPGARQGPQQAGPDRLPRGGLREDPARRPDPPRGGALRAHPARAGAEDPRLHRGAAARRPGGRAGHPPRGERRTTTGTCPASGSCARARA